MSRTSQEAKRTEASARHEAYNKLTPKQRLDKLDAKLGKGVGAKKERAKLAALIANKPAEKKGKKDAQE